MSEDSSKHFRQFASALKGRLEKYKELTDEESFALQKKQVERLLYLEDEWRAAVIKHAKGEHLYRGFIHHIRSERKNILDARPFFRERQSSIFTAKIAPCLRSGDWKKLQNYRVNWCFIAWALKSEQWRKGSNVVKLAKQIETIRAELVEANLPLAINRSRIFWEKTQKSHLSFMELISIATEGLIAAVDKFVPPYTKVFALVASYRMLGNFIEAYSQKMLYFWPSDMRKLYRANKFMSKSVEGDIDYGDLVTEVNRDAPHKQLADEAEIRSLILASSTVSADAERSISPSGSGSDDTVTNLSRYEAPDCWRPDLTVEKAEALGTMFEKAQSLTLIERKLLRLKGVRVSLELTNPVM
jgi:DNA-directed RNA polymerase specialized sigma subunit